MSYILDALKKSQQERELGHVPTLDTPTFLSEEDGVRPSVWVLAAVVLAGLAMIVALYSAFRATVPIPEPIETVAEKPLSAAPVRDVPASSSPDLQVAVGSDSDIARSSPGSTPSSLPAIEETGDSERPVVIEAPAAAPPSPAVQVIEPDPTPLPVRTQRTEVPQDLVADIEAFKREVREERSTKTRPEKKKEKRAPLNWRRLPKRARDRMPEFVMSAHIYDKEPGKRFVLINGLKTREGEESREEIAVEEILPDGAILRYDGNRFFQRRR
jgi:general secretion pathway protein B